MHVARGEKALGLRLAALFGRDTLEQYLSHYHPNAKLHFLPPGLPQGREGLKLYYTMLLDAFPMRAFASRTSSPKATR